MEREAVLVGIDVGTTKIVALIGEVSRDGALTIIGKGPVAATGLKKGVVVNIDQTVHSIATAVEHAERLSGWKIDRAFVGVGGQHIEGMNSKGQIAVSGANREITREDISRAIEVARAVTIPSNRDVLHVLPRGFVVDGQDGVKDPVGMSGSRLEVETHIVTGSTAFLDNVVKCVRRAGLEIDTTVLEPIATGESAALPAEKDLGVVLIDIGGGTTDVAVFVNGEIYYTAVLPIGGDHVTRDMAIGLRASQEEAEEAKLKYGCATNDMVDMDDTFRVKSLGDEQPRELPREMLVEIIEPRMQEILQMVREEVIKSGYIDMLPAGAVLTGGGALMRGTIQLAEKILGMPTRIGLPQGVGGLNDTVQSPVYTTGVGLVIYAARVRADLREEEKRGGIIQGVIDLFRRPR